MSLTRDSDLDAAVDGTETVAGAAVAKAVEETDRKARTKADRAAKAAMVKAAMVKAATRSAAATAAASGAAEVAVAVAASKAVANLKADHGRVR